ncbi:MAG: hypothetical protein WCS77_09625 [Elusimicrobiaceae bacterium]
MKKDFKVVFPRKVVELVNERQSYLKRHIPDDRTKCLFCGSEISARSFFLLKDGETRYTIGCVHCGGARETVPSVNPFMFINTVRRNTN